MIDATSIRLPTVQLLHKLPDGSAHIDWLIAPDSAGRERAVTFRLARRVDELSPAQPDHALEVERIADHRVVYLDYEGPLADAPGAAPDSGDRGEVRRLRRGWVVRWDRRESRWGLSIVWEGDEVPQELCLEPVRGTYWRLSALSSGEVRTRKESS